MHHVHYLKDSKQRKIFLRQNKPTGHCSALLNSYRYACLYVAYRFTLSHTRRACQIYRHVTHLKESRFVDLHVTQLSLNRKFQQFHCNNLLRDTQMWEYLHSIYILHGITKFKKSEVSITV